uniref:Uncharacterized protein n=1 Tax=Mus spicilegus TaxID=10103 RepID=A0A8C6GNF6_MUSSI
MTHTLTTAQLPKKIGICTMTLSQGELVAFIEVSHPTPVLTLISFLVLCMSENIFSVSFS